MKSFRLLMLAFTLVSALCCGVSAYAQNDFVGRVYENKNIMADEMNKAMKDADSNMDKAKAEAIAKAEEKKGRKLTADELAEVDKQMVEARKLLEAMRKGMSTGVSVEFKSEKDMVMRMDMKVSDDVLKAAGVSWVKRKAMKAALAIAPKSQKATYVVNGNMIICDDGSKEKDTLTVSADGKYLYGKMDEKTKFRLTRTK